MKNLVSPIAILVAASILTGCAQIVMRWGGKHAAAQQSQHWLEWLWISRWWILGLMAGWLGGLGAAWSLRKVNISLAVPVYSGLAYLLSVLGGFLLLRETMSPVQAAGMIVILVGMVMLSIH